MSLAHHPDHLGPRWSPQVWRQFPDGQHQEVWGSTRAAGPPSPPSGWSPAGRKQRRQGLREVLDDCSAGAFYLSHYLLLDIWPMSRTRGIWLHKIQLQFSSVGWQPPRAFGIQLEAKQGPSTGPSLSPGPHDHLGLEGLWPPPMMAGCAVRKCRRVAADCVNCTRLSIQAGNQRAPPRIIWGARKLIHPSLAFLSACCQCQQDQTLCTPISERLSLIPDRSC